MTYERRDVLTFGRELLHTGDLDPVYVALVGARWDDNFLKAWLVAYWCFYHCGAACAIAEAPDFWGAMATAAANEALSPTGERWPRGKERRHFRGQQAERAVAELRTRYEQPRDMVSYVADGAPSCAEVMRRVQTHRGFGPWIAFKAADMVERVMRVHVDFSEADVLMFEEPVEAALMLWRQHHGGARPKDEKAALRQVMSYLQAQFSSYLAPPTGDRPVGLQEVETILCKWKSHVNGHYPPGNDLREIREGLGPWVACSPAARRFLEMMP